MNTRNNIRGGLVSMTMVIMLFFLVASPAQYRTHHELANVGTARNHAYGLTNTSDSITRLGEDERKVALVSCAKVQCEPKHLCYCCMTEKPEPLCYDTLGECRAVCPSCNPTCPP
ncbi:unnamed protein product [Urochloa decumbens]|uniref:Bowman-Birk serine protease inhibitors family domain-containing protein n=1 Tax=Urochloa decumbens TaxID=240449 RepID=A0ABC8X8P3_9POAL